MSTTPLPPTTEISSKLLETSEATTSSTTFKQTTFTESSTTENLPSSTMSATTSLLYSFRLFNRLRPTRFLQQLSQRATMSNEFLGTQLTSQFATTFEPATESPKTTSFDDIFTESTKGCMKWHLPRCRRLKFRAFRLPQRLAKLPHLPKQWNRHRQPNRRLMGLFFPLLWHKHFLLVFVACSVADTDLLTFSLTFSHPESRWSRSSCQIYLRNQPTPIRWVFSSPPRGIGPTVLSHNADRGGHWTDWVIAYQVVFTRPPAYRPVEALPACPCGSDHQHFQPLSPERHFSGHTNTWNHHTATKETKSRPDPVSATTTRSPIFRSSRNWLREPSCGSWRNTCRGLIYSLSTSLHSEPTILPRLRYYRSPTTFCRLLMREMAAHYSFWTCRLLLTQSTTACFWIDYRTASACPPLP